MVQKLRVLFALSEFHSWTPSVHIWGFTTSCNSGPRDLIMFSGLSGYSLTHIHTFIQTQTKKNNVFKDKDILSLDAYYND